MPEQRTEFTDALALLALMKTNPDAYNWSFPYWNQLVLDAVINALHDAPRTSSALVADPTGSVGLAIGSGGELIAGVTVYVRQSFVDEYGRETAATTAASQVTNDPIDDPAAGPTVTYVSDPTTGYDGGPLNIWITYSDGSGGETLPSPIVQEDLPYNYGGALNLVNVEVPTSPTGLGVDAIYVYAQWRGGNVVRAAEITGTDVDVDIDPSNPLDCYPVLPSYNTTNRTQKITITPVSTPTNAVYTRFYIKDLESDWTGDLRLTLNSADEWAVGSIPSPLEYSGAAGEKGPGYPRDMSAVLPVRAIDLAAEVEGILDETFIDAEVARDAEVAAVLGGPFVVSGLLVEAQTSPDMTVKSATGWAVSDSRIWNPAADSSVGIDTADGTNPRIDIVCVDDTGAIVSSAEDAACKGTAAPSPSAPSTPTGYVLLAEVSVPASDTTIESGQITDMRDLYDLSGHITDSDAHFTGTEKTDRLLSSANMTDLTDGGITTLHKHATAVSVFFPGSLTVGDLVSIILPRAVNVVSPYGKIYVDTVNTGADLIVEVKKNGTTIYGSTPANRPTVTDSDADGWGAVAAPDTVAFAQFDLMTIEVAQVGSTVAGSDLSVMLALE